MLAVVALYSFYSLVLFFHVKDFLKQLAAVFSQKTKLHLTTPLCNFGLVQLSVPLLLFSFMTVALGLAHYAT